MNCIDLLLSRAKEIIKFYDNNENYFKMLK